jgi:hypothetical protein
MHTLPGIAETPPLASHPCPCSMPQTRSTRSSHPACRARAPAYAGRLALTVVHARSGQRKGELPRLALLYAVYAGPSLLPAWEPHAHTLGLATRTPPFAPLDLVPASQLMCEGATVTLASLVELAHEPRAGPTLLARGNSGARAADAVLMWAEHGLGLRPCSPVGQPRQRCMAALALALSSVLHTRFSAHPSCMYCLTLDFPFCAFIYQLILMSRSSMLARVRAVVNAYPT